MPKSNTLKLSDTQFVILSSASQREDARMGGLRPHVTRLRTLHWSASTSEAGRKRTGGFWLPARERGR
jgi:hypothetical protein